jgi:hypothetical protein
MLHEPLPERHARPSNPLASASRAVLAFHANDQHFPDGDADRIRFIENDRTTGNMLEARFPELDTIINPVFVDTRNARETYVRSWINGDKDISGDPTVKTFMLSIEYGSIKKGNKGKLPPFPEPGPPVKLGNGYGICNMKTGVKRVSYIHYIGSKIPRCISKHVELEHVHIESLSVKKIENLEKLVNLKELDLNGTRIAKIENLDKNVNLESLDLRYSNVAKIENLGKNVDLEELILSDTSVAKIENLDTNVKLRELDLSGTPVSKIENLDKNVNLKELDLSNTSVTKIENLDTNVKLRILDLSNTNVSKIENLGKNVNLEELLLSDTHVAKIENLGKNVKLGYLNLRNTPVTDDEKRAFDDERNLNIVY